MTHEDFLKIETGDRIKFKGFEWTVDTKVPSPDGGDMGHGYFNLIVHRDSAEGQLHAKVNHFEHLSVEKI